MSAKKFTVLIIPEGSHQVRRFSVLRRSLQTAGALGVLLLLALGLLAYGYFRQSVDQKELEQLRVQAVSREKEINGLVANLEQLRQEMTILAQNDAKVRVLANLTPPKPDSLAGVGGSPEEISTEKLSALQQKIDGLAREIDLRRASQEEIRGMLNDQRSLLAAKPSGWPVKGWMTSNFGMRRSPFTGKRKMHEGVDIASRTGTPVFATADGIVSKAETAAGYGKLVVIDHGYGYKTYYAHNSKIFVKVGQRVKRNERISAVGNTGSSTGSHVHYEVHLNGVPVNPKKYL